MMLRLCPLLVALIPHPSNISILLPVEGIPKNPQNALRGIDLRGLSFTLCF
jgi:hypothetical protein